MGTRPLFPVFPLFKVWVIESPKIFKQILADLFLITEKDHLTNVPTFIEVHGTKRQRQGFENGHFLVFFEMSLFEIQSALLAD